MPTPDAGMQKASRPHIILTRLLSATKGSEDAEGVSARSAAGLTVARAVS